MVTDSTLAQAGVWRESGDVKARNCDLVAAAQDFVLHREAGHREVGAEWGVVKRRMSAAPPTRSRVVYDRDTLMSLIVVAAAMLNAEKLGRPFAFDLLLRKMRDLLGRGQVLNVVDVRAALPKMGFCLTRTWRGWRWKRPCETVSRR